MHATHGYTALTNPFGTRRNSHACMMRGSLAGVMPTKYSGDFGESDKVRQLLFPYTDDMVDALITRIVTHMHALMAARTATRCNSTNTTCADNGIAYGSGNNVSCLLFFVRFRVELSNGLYKVNKILLQTSFRPADQQDLGEQELKKGDR
jgi:hypothetical protein